MMVSQSLTAFLPAEMCEDALSGRNSVRTNLKQRYILTRARERFAIDCLSRLWCALRQALQAIVVGVAALGMHMGPAWAEGATMLLPDICDDPAAIFDYQWTKAKFQVDGLFLMLNDGSVELLKGQKNFDEYDDIYVAAHGGSNEVGGITYKEFAKYFRDNHQDAPNSVVFAVCSAAQGADNLLKELDDQYGNSGGNIKALYGGTKECALAGNGNTNLAQASYRVDVIQSDPGLYQKIVHNIMVKWLGQYNNSDMNYQNFCRSNLKPINAIGLNNFIDAVYDRFRVDFTAQLQYSTNYLRLIALNKDGNEMVACGANPRGQGPVPCSAPQ